MHQPQILFDIHTVLFLIEKIVHHEAANINRLTGFEMYGEKKRLFHWFYNR